MISFSVMNPRERALSKNLSNDICDGGGVFTYGGSLRAGCFDFGFATGREMTAFMGLRTKAFFGCGRFGAGFTAFFGAGRDG